MLPWVSKINKHENKPTQQQQTSSCEPVAIMCLSKEKMPLGFTNIFQNNILALQVLLLPLCIYDSSMPVPTLDILDEVSDTSTVFYM